MSSSEQRHAVSNFVRCCQDMGFSTHSNRALANLPNLDPVLSFATGEEQEEVCAVLNACKTRLTLAPALDPATLNMIDSGLSHCLHLCIGMGHGWATPARVSLFVAAVELKTRVKILRGQCQAAANLLQVAISTSLLQDVVLEDLIEDLDCVAPPGVIVPVLHQAVRSRIGREAGVPARLHSRVAALVVPAPHPAAQHTHQSRSNQLRMASLRLAEAGAQIDSNRGQARRWYCSPSMNIPDPSLNMPGPGAA